MSDFRHIFPTLHKRKLELAIPAVGLRCNIPADFSRKPEELFLRRLRQIDPELEMLWMSRRGRWACYRVVDRHTCPGEDRLMLCGILEGPERDYREPGEWYIQALQRGDAARDGGPDQVERNISLADKREAYETSEREGKFHQDMTADAVNNIGMACRGRTSFSSALSTANNKRHKRWT